MEGTGDRGCQEKVLDEVPGRLLLEMVRLGQDGQVRAGGSEDSQLGRSDEKLQS